MRKVLRTLLGLPMLVLMATSDLKAWSCESPAWGWNVGVTSTSEPEFQDPSWTSHVTFECFGPKVRPRGILGLANLDQGKSSDATYGYLAGGLMFGRVVSGTVALGVYHVTLDEPIVSDTTRKLEFGYNGGVQFLLPV